MCFTVQLSRSVPFPELSVPASAATRSFYHNVLRLSRTFFKSFSVCFSSDRSFLIFPGTSGTEAYHFLTSHLQRTFIFYHSTSSLSRTFLTFFQSFLNFGWTFKGHRIPAAILYLLSVWRPPQRQLCYDIIASSICQLYF